MTLGVQPVIIIALWNIFRHGGSCCDFWFNTTIVISIFPRVKNLEKLLSPLEVGGGVLHWYDCHWAGRTIPRSRGAGWGAGLRPI